METKHNAQHTPTPWTTYDRGEPYGETGITTPTGWVAFVSTPHDAAYIVRAVNAHAKLVTALEAILPDYEHLAFPEDDSLVCQRRQTVVNQARAVLKKK